MYIHIESVALFTAFHAFASFFFIEERRSLWSCWWLNSKIDRQIAVAVFALFWFCFDFALPLHENSSSCGMAHVDCDQYRPCHHGDGAMMLKTRPPRNDPRLKKKKNITEDVCQSIKPMYFAKVIIDGPVYYIKTTEKLFTSFISSRNLY